MSQAHILCKQLDIKISVVNRTGVKKLPHTLKIEPDLKITETNIDKNPNTQHLFQQEKY